MKILALGILLVVTVSPAGAQKSAKSLPQCGQYCYARCEAAVRSGNAGMAGCMARCRQGNQANTKPRCQGT